MKKQFFIFIYILAFQVLEVSGQSFDDYRKEALEEFQAYKQKNIKEFESYRDSINAEFAKYMRLGWTLTEGHSGIPKPEQEEPDIPPVILPDIEIPEIIDDSEIPFSEVIPIVPDDIPVPILPINPIPDREEIEFSFNFYGSNCCVRFNPDKKFTLKDASENSVADMWSAMASEDYDNLLYDCLSNKTRLSLCDWGYYSFLGKVAEKIYGNSNEGVMLKVYLMSQSGYKVRVGRNDDNQLKLLISLTDDLYDYGYYILDDTHYYLTEKDESESLYIFDRMFPNEKSLRMSISTAPNFPVRKSQPRNLHSKRYPDVAAISCINENLISFYNDYPSSYKRDCEYSQWVNYANTPVSENVRDSVYPVLARGINALSKSDAANVLINFVQTAFDYKKDEECWGEERSFFPEETLYYPYSDCEDRAILFSRIVRDLLELKVVLIYYPGHLATGVSFTENVTGDYICLDGEKFLICDPTYIGAQIGKTMPGMDNSNAVVVMLD